MIRVQEGRENIYTQVHRDQAVYTCRLDVSKARMHIHTLSRKEKCVHVGKLGFGSWYLVPGILICGIDPRYLVRSVDPRYLDQGIDSKWFWTMVLRKA